MDTGFRRSVVALVLTGVGIAAAPRNPDSAESLARVRLVVTTRAATAAITIGGATIASYISSVLDGPPTASASLTGRTLQLSGNAGSPPKLASTSSSLTSCLAADRVEPGPLTRAPTRRSNCIR
jgi:hypothetical protein